MRLGVIGDGRAAKALVPRWLAAGHALAWQHRRSDPCPLSSRPAVDVVILAVRDGDLAEVARELGLRPGADGERWLHLSGVTPGAALRQSPAIPRASGALHPLVALAGASGVGPLGAVAGVDGDPEAVACAEVLAEACGLSPVRLAAPHAKALYHAAAVTVAGHLTALFSQGLRLMALAGLSPPEAHAALLPLARSALDNLAHGAPGAVITGPAARGDVGTIARHLEALEAAPEGVRAVYRALGREAVALSAEAGGIAPEVAARLDALLSGGAA